MLRTRRFPPPCKTELTERRIGFHLTVNSHRGKSRVAEILHSYIDGDWVRADPSIKNINPRDVSDIAGRCG
jgi:hypothetical protein